MLTLLTQARIRINDKAVFCFRGSSQFWIKIMDSVHIAANNCNITMSRQ